MDIKLEDMNKDGTIDEADEKIYTDMIKSKSQLCLACISLLSIIGVTILMFSSWVPVEKINAMETLLEFFYVAMGTIVAAWFGLDSYLSLNKSK